MSRYEYDPEGTAYSQGRRDGYAAGFAAALAQLREPSDELITAVDPFIEIGSPWQALRAAASALADSLKEDK